MAPDISWSGPAGTFNLRVTAVITRGEEILVCTVGRLGYWFLPGGRVRLGESSEEALARELAEELGHVLPGGRLALVAENIFEARTLQHEIGLYYRVPWPAALVPDDLRGGTEPGHTFRWMAAAALGSVRFEPAGLIPLLPDLGDTLRHVILSRGGCDRLASAQRGGFFSCGRCGPRRGGGMLTAWTWAASCRSSPGSRWQY